MPSVRAYRSEDRDVLMLIWEAASRIGHPFLTETDLAEQKLLVRDVYLPKAENWVTLIGDRPVGFIGLLGNLVGGLFVEPHMHKSGIGSALIKHASALKGPLEVEVYALNDAALLFYQHVGFREVGRRATDDQGRELELLRRG
jgi:GNAT superfamily N-acetyltransferase